MTLSNLLIPAGLFASVLAVYCLHTLLQRHEERVKAELTVAEWPRPNLYVLPAPWDQAKDVAS